MGLSPSILSVPSIRELTGKTRWPPSLQSVDLPQLMQWYTIFRELGSLTARPRHLALVLEVSEADILIAAEVWQVGKDGQLNVWEFLTALSATSTSLTLLTKLNFFFRMWDVDQDKILNRAELAFLLRAVLYCLAHYCRCDLALLPDAHRIQHYVERTFKPKTTEDAFVKWVMRYRLLRDILMAFPPRAGCVDLVDFVLQGPRQESHGERQFQSSLKARTLSNRKNQGMSSFGLHKKNEKGKPSKRGEHLNLESSIRAPIDDLDGFGEEGDSEDDEQKKMTEKVTSARAKSKPKSNVNFALPTVGEGFEEDEEEEEEEGQKLDKASLFGTEEKIVLPTVQRNFKFMDNVPANVAGQCPLLGQIRLLELRASEDDLEHYCAVHGDDALCMLFSKHEVLLTHRIWSFLKDNRDIELSGVRELMDVLHAQVAESSSILVQSSHRNIFQMMDIRYNKIFKDVVRRLRRGARVAFQDFLRASCPCASDARICLYDYWHTHLHWAQENATSGLIKQWRKDFESTKSSSEINVHCDLTDVDPNEKVLSIDDIVAGSIVPKEVAEEIMQHHEHLTVESELNQEEFIYYFCGAMEGSTFEDVMRRKFERLVAVTNNHRKANTNDLNAMKQARNEKKRLRSKTFTGLSRDDEDENASGFSLNELVNVEELKAAFCLDDACTEAMPPDMPQPAAQLDMSHMRLPPAPSRRASV